MIVISLVFFVLGVGLLATGLVVESIQLELGAVASALLSALALYGGLRRRRGAAAQGTGSTEAEQVRPAGPDRGRVVEDGWSAPADEAWPTNSAVDSAMPSTADHGWGDAMAPPAEPAEAARAVESDLARSASLDEEPAEEETSPTNVARVAAHSDAVLVVDGRPRYHRRACSSLPGREAVPLPVREAREAGFTPCARCRPDAHLLRSLEPPQQH